MASSPAPRVFLYGLWTRCSLFFDPLVECLDGGLSDSGWLVSVEAIRHGVIESSRKVGAVIED